MVETEINPSIEPKIVFTVGHSDRSIAEFIALLQSAKVQTIIDCRTRPRSRWAQFRQGPLCNHLNAVGISYEPRGRNIGGLAGNVEFDETLDEIARRAEEGEQIALLCAEGDYKKCHRGTLLAPELEKRGMTVGHLLYRSKQSPRQRTL